MSEPQRGQWSSQVGFILAAAGSAIGLGNIWRFPYSAGENGGGAFVLVYLLCVVAIGLPVMLLEISVGRATQKNPVGAIEAIAPRSLWKGIGYLAILT
ncbi:MAG TPA: sodium-dependent transporter, partial [Acidobacteria bacterium]|nr:sodium-dependent transporter [Acidobacteriota bacterium]